MTTRSLLAPLLLAGALLVLGTQSSAHTAVRKAEPGPGQVVEGPITELRLAFLDDVAPGTDVTVADEAGTPVPGLGTPEHVAPDEVVVRFDPIEGPGRFQASYEYAAVDGDVQVGSHQFTVRPASGGALAPLAIGAVALFAVAVAAWWWWRRSRPSREHAP